MGSSAGGRYVGTFGDAAVFSMELSKTLSCGWGGILAARNRKLAAAAARLYSGIPEPSWWASTRDILQTAISALCHRPGVFGRFGKYVLAAGFRSRVFRLSTPEAEFQGQVLPDFMRKMGGAQAWLAALQWRDLGKIASACEAHASEIRRELQNLSIPALGTPAADEISVAPRVSFLVTDRQAASAYFRSRGIELGQWFDGPLSPVPTSSLFNFEPGRYPQAEKVARSVVNLPCHGTLEAVDLAHILATLSESVRDRLYRVKPTA